MNKLETVAIIGIGLIGGSLGRAILDRKLANKVIGIDTNQDNLTEAMKLGAASEICTSIREGAENAELIIVGTPVHAIPAIVEEATKANRRAALVTDVGSTKTALIQTLRAAPLPNGCRFLGGHPIAGREVSGTKYADPNLFVGKTVILTPSDPVDRKAGTDVQNTPLTPEFIRNLMSRNNLDIEDQEEFQKYVQTRLILKARDYELLHNLWESVGALVVQMPPERHDSVCSQLSHLPHLLSALLMFQTDSVLFPLLGPGFKSVSRLAGGNVDLWKDVIADNRENIVRDLDKFIHNVLKLRGAIDSADEFSYSTILEEANRKYHDCYPNEAEPQQ